MDEDVVLANSSKQFLRRVQPGKVGGRALRQAFQVVAGSTFDEFVDVGVCRKIKRPGDVKEDVGFDIEFGFKD